MDPKLAGYMIEILVMLSFLGGFRFILEAFKEKKWCYGAIGIILILISIIPYI
jgi:glucose uptake protein GlcU